MMREYIVNHLINEGCFPVDEFDVPGVAQLWRNSIGGHECYVPYVDELTVPTYCQIFYELHINPPLEEGYDSDYAVYSSFRELRLKNVVEEHSANNPEDPDSNSTNSEFIPPSEN